MNFLNFTIWRVRSLYLLPFRFHHPPNSDCIIIRSLEKRWRKLYFRFFDCIHIHNTNNKRSESPFATECSSWTHRHRDLVACAAALVEFVFLLLIDVLSTSERGCLIHHKMNMITWPSSSLSMVWIVMWTRMMNDLWICCMRRALCSRFWALPYWIQLAMHSRKLTHN